MSDLRLPHQLIKTSKRDFIHGTLFSNKLRSTSVYTKVGLVCTKISKQHVVIRMDDDEIDIKSTFRFSSFLYRHENQWYK